MDNECPICHFTPLKVVTSWTPRNPGRRFNCCANIVSFDILISFNFGLLDYDLIDKCSLVVGLSPGLIPLCVEDLFRSYLACCKEWTTCKIQWQDNWIKFEDWRWCWVSVGSCLLSTILVIDVLILCFGWCDKIL